MSKYFVDSRLSRGPTPKMVHMVHLVQSLHQSKGTGHVYPVTAAWANDEDTANRIRDMLNGDSEQATIIRRQREQNDKIAADAADLREAYRKVLAAAEGRPASMPIDEYVKHLESLNAAYVHQLASGEPKSTDTAREKTEAEVINERIERIESHIKRMMQCSIWKL